MFSYSSMLKTISLLALLSAIPVFSATRDEQKGQRDNDLRGDKLNREQLALSCLKDQLKESEFNPKKNNFKKYIELCKEVAKRQQEAERLKADEKRKRDLDEKNKKDKDPKKDTRNSKLVNNQKTRAHDRRNNEPAGPTPNKNKDTRQRQKVVSTGSGSGTSNNTQTSTTTTNNSQSGNEATVDNGNLKAKCLNTDNTIQFNSDQKNRCCRLISDFEVRFVEQLNKFPNIKKFVSLIHKEGITTVQDKINSKQFKFDGSDEHIGDDFLALDDFFSFIAFFYEDPAFNNKKREKMYNALSAGEIASANDQIKTIKDSILQDLDNAKAFVVRFDDEMPGNISVQNLKQRKQSLGCN